MKKEEFKEKNVGLQASNVWEEADKLSRLCLKKAQNATTKREKDSYITDWKRAETAKEKMNEIIRKVKIIDKTCGEEQNTSTQKQEK